MTSRVVWAAVNEQIKAETAGLTDRFFGFVHAATTTSTIRSPAYMPQARTFFKQTDAARRREDIAR